MPGRIRVYIATSLDGFIAGPGNDLSWLPQDGDFEGGTTGVDYEDFMADVGALLMGRATYDVVLGFGVDWPYGDKPVLVATHRPLEPAAPTVRAVSGSIDELLDEALQAARGKDVYVDGGTLIRQALDAGRIDELVISVAPVVLGSGHALFAGVEQRTRFSIEHVGPYGGGMFQLVATPVRA